MRKGKDNSYTDNDDVVDAKIALLVALREYEARS